MIPKQTLLQKIIYHPIAIILISSFAIVATVGLVKELISKPFFNLLFFSEVYVKTFTACVGSLVMIGTYYLLNRFYEKIPFSEFELIHAQKEFVQGLLLGFGSIGVVVLMLYFLGYYQFLEIVSFQKFLPTIAFIFGAAVLEEIVFRGLLFRLLEKWKGPILAILFSSIIFQLPHFMNSHTGIIPAFLGVLFGLVMALMYAHTRRLWLPIAFHFAWNITQPALGTTLSGVTEFTPLSKAKLHGPEIFIGNDFGIETSLFSFASLLIVGGYYFWKLKQINYFNTKV